MNDTHAALIVEDEKLARMELCSLLAKEPSVNVVGEAGNVDEATRMIEQLAPDVVFLDIQLGKESGFDVLSRSPKGFDVIFVTAFDQHAIRAFELNAVDYLLKPVNPDRLREAISRIGRPRGQNQAPQDALHADDRLFVKIDHRWRFLLVRHIVWIEAVGDYTRVHVRDDTSMLMPKPLREWETRLPPHLFARIHRSTIVNLDCVERVTEWSNKTFQVFIDGRAEPFRMSRRYAARLRR